MRQNHRALAVALEAGEDVQQKGIIPVLRGRDAKGEAVIEVVGPIDAAGPVLVGKRRIGDHKVESLQPALRVLEMWRG